MAVNLPNDATRFPPTGQGKTVQIRVKRGRVVLGHSEGTVMWVEPSRARQLKDQNAIDIIGESVAVPESKPAGPSETKPAAPAEKKSSDARPSGPSTDSASSNRSGPEKSPAVSEAAQASLESISSSSEKLSDPAAAEPSRSTIPTSRRPGRT